MRTRPIRARFTVPPIASLLLALLFAAPAARAQDSSVQIDPPALEVAVGETEQLRVTVFGADGEPVLDSTLFVYARDRRSLAVDETSEMTPYRTFDVMGLAPGTHSVLVVRAAPEGGRRTLAGEVTVEVPYPPVERVAVVDLPARVYAGTTLPLTTRVVDAAGAERDDVAVAFSTSDAAVAAVDDGGALVAMRPGRVTLSAAAEGARATQAVEVIPNPTDRLELRGGAGTARTGDVLDFDAVGRDAAGAVVADLPVAYSVTARPADNLGAAASALVDAEGRFVAETPGRYTIVATSGDHVARHVVEVAPREVAGRFELVGQGLVSDVHTSDLWIWEGADGRDYAITGTWGGRGEAYFWDVTDPAAPVIVDTVTVDARTVNDVKVSEDGSVCVVSREGASNRRNGLVILDCSNPRDVAVLAEYDDELTGGVHNVFIYDDHIYAVNHGRRYDIINIEDPTAPRRVGRFELETPGHAIHDVWIEDGIAYSSNWDDGVVMVDVGNGMAGGSPSNPVEIGRYAYPSGWNHAAFPYRDEETGKFYIVAGDEAFPYGLHVDDRPTEAAGWIHFIDFTDPKNPKEVARYEVPEAGTHNFWVEDDRLYVAYYNGGVRVVDLSGDLMGDLYRQGREVARYSTPAPNGRIPNAPMAWGPQPHKGHLFVSDWNSGLWVLKLHEPQKQQAEPGI